MKQIYLNGVVVDNINQLYEMGMDDFSFIELSDIQRQFSELGKKDKEVMIHINSRGGSVDAGNKIFDFLRVQQLENGITIHTRADGDCASIATKILMAADVKNRSITSNANVMIHLPWLEMGGNSDELRAMADEMEVLNSDFAKFYSERTGLKESEALQFMKNETYFSADDCIKYGIVGKKIETIKAFAFNINNKQINKMSEKSALKKALNALKSFAGIMNADLTGVDGTRIEFEGDELALAMEVKGFDADGNPIEILTKDIQTEDGTVYVIVENVVTDIKEAEEPMDVEAMKAELEALKAENAELKALTTEATESILALQKGIGKTLSLKGKEATFAKVEDKEVKNRIEGFNKKMK